MKLWRGRSWRGRSAVVAGAAALVLVAGCAVGYAVTDVPAPSKISTDQALRLLYADGSPLASFGKNRIIVPLDQVSLAAQHAVLAAEDRDFYSEPGISIKGIARALFTNIKGGGVSQGGSTITQQYAKNAFLTQQRTFSRKIKEVFIAVKMSQTVSKQQILEDYLNTIYFGRGAFGIEAASETYFHVRASQLDVARAAVLASSIRSPAGYDPARHPERAKARWDYVLDGMVKKGWLSQQERSSTTYPKLPSRQESGQALPGDLYYVRDRVVAELQRHGFPEDRIAAGGLTITTTISKQAQDAARTVMDERVPRGKADAPVGALVAVQPGSGRVVAYYGGRDAGGFDYADSDQTTGVQPGSSMKPYVLAAALSQGKHLSDRYDGSSPQDICGQTIHNDKGDPPFGRIDLSTAMAQSVNTVYFRLACDVGPKSVADVAHAAGVRASLGGPHPGAGIALGIYELHPIEQAVGYATFAAKGRAAEPFFVLKVSDRRGNELYRAKPTTTDAFSSDIAANTTAAMVKVVTDGTGTKAKIPGRPTAGKTGTTQDNKNAWFCGFTPQLAAAVWVGRPHGGSLGANGYGGTIAAPIFSEFMDKALQGQPVEQFPPATDQGSSPTATATSTPPATPSATPTPTPLVTVAPPGQSLPPVIPSQSPPPSAPPPSPASSPSPSAPPAASQSPAPAPAPTH